jgi:hypothetical protein
VAWALIVNPWAARVRDSWVEVAGAGTELPPQNEVNFATGGESGAQSGAPGAPNGPVNPDLVAVVEAWPSLPAALKAGILAMVRAAG